MTSTKTSAKATSGLVTLGRSGDGAPLASAFGSKTQVLTFPSDLTERERGNIAIGFIVLGASTSESPNKWATYLISYFCLMITNFISKLPAHQYEQIQIKKTDITQQLLLLERVRAQAELDDTAPDSIPPNGLDGFVLHPDLPTAPTHKNAQLIGQDYSIRTSYAHLSMVVYLAGKQITAANRRQMVTARPTALTDAFKLPAQVTFLFGEWMLSDQSYEKINQAWKERTAFRQAAFKEMILYSKGDTDLGQQILYQNVKLLKWAYHSHVPMVMQLVKSYPWVREMPIMKDSMYEYDTSTEVYLAQKPILRPYLKLLGNDSCELFLRKNLEPLIACAVADQAQVHATINNYYTDSKYAGVVDQFITQRNKLETMRLAAVLGEAVPPEVEEDDGEEPEEEGVTAEV